LDRSKTAYGLIPGVHIIGFEPLKCANDAEAIEKAKQPERSQAAVPPNGHLKFQEKSYAHH
jgi:hypothetical protein